MVSPDASSPGLAYLTTAYPSVSHTFIRREILALERLGHAIHRFAIRRGTFAGDPEDQREQEQTFHLLEQSRSWLLRSALATFVRSPGAAIQALVETLRLSSASERGLLRHFAYFVEALALTEVFRQRNITHVHVHFGTNAAAVAMLVDILGVATFSMTVHGPDEFDAAIGLSLGRKIAASRFTVAISSYCASQLMRWASPEHWAKIHIVHCTVDSTWFSTSVPVNPDSDTYVAVGRLSAQKGQFLLVESVAAAAQRGFSGRVVLVGDGELRRPLQASIDALGLADRITITGWCTGNEVQQHLIAARALVLPSFAEGLPMVLMEAMALQRPVIASTIAGIPELVRDGIEGWLTIAGDKQTLVDALLRAQSTPFDTVSRMGKAGRARVHARHSSEQQARKLSALFEEISDLGARTRGNGDAA